MGNGCHLKIFSLLFQVKVVFNVNGRKAKLFRTPDLKDEVSSHTVSDVLSLHAKMLYAV